VILVVAGLCRCYHSFLLVATGFWMLHSDSVVTVVLCSFVCSVGRFLVLLVGWFLFVWFSSFHVLRFAGSGRWFDVVGWLVGCCRYVPHYVPLLVLAPLPLHLVRFLALVLWVLRYLQFILRFCWSLYCPSGLRCRFFVTVLGSFWFCFLVLSSVGLVSTVRF